MTDHLPSDIETTSTMRLARRPWKRRLLVTTSILVAALVISQAVISVHTWQTLKHRDTEPTAFMKNDRARAHDPELPRSLQLQMAHPAWQWVPIDSVSQEALLVVLSREDQQFPGRSLPFSVGQALDRAKAWVTRDKKGDPFGSTIPQQVAKNLFTGGSRSAWRKAIEADYAFHLFARLSNRQILETYLNSIEFGPGIWGICAASWYYFDRPPSTLARLDMADLVGLMPAPKTRTIYPASPSVQFAEKHADQYVDSLLRGNASSTLGQLTRVHGAYKSTGCQREPKSLVARIAATTDSHGYPLFRGDQSWWARTTCEYVKHELPESVTVSRKELARRAQHTPCG